MSQPAIRKCEALGHAPNSILPLFGPCECKVLSSSRYVVVLLFAWILCSGVEAKVTSGRAVQAVNRTAKAQAGSPGEDAAKLEAIITTDSGVIRVEFFADKAPKHVEQFIKLARQGYYDGSAFFRVIPHGLIQGGDPLVKNSATPRERWGTGGLNLTPDEPNNVKHEKGVVSTVAIPGKASSGGAQFFICDSPQPQLDGSFSAFGKVTEGIDVVDKIASISVDSNYIADKPVRIVSVKIEPKRVPPFESATVEQLRKQVVLKTSLGDVTIQLQPELAPETVRNFLNLAASGWYDHTAFHRLIPGFVIQGGLGNTRAGGAPHPADRWVHDLKGEFTSEVKHDRGIVSMARGDDPDSGNTSFFICLGPAPHLDGKYAIFGKVVAGGEVLDKFDKAPVEGQSPAERIELIQAVVKQD
ncbi:MAG TPA: peptidylprolyl isomerase [Blastocatellia bacterium]|nr:peptidylprolyl isomerase [Blastocatellia bacterium]